MSATIELRNVKRVFPDGTEAVAGVSLEIPQSKTTSIVGPSGSGKSTVLKIIAGLMEPTEGRVLFDGRDVTHVPPEKRNIGIVFQSYALFPNMNVQENVEFGLLVRKVPKEERCRRALETLEMVQIPHLAHRRIRQLSGGEQQRVALARAVVMNPDILLLDEPLSALDAKIREELRAELSRLLRQFKITAVYVTHDQAEAMVLGDRVVVMNKGCLMQVGTPLEIFDRPANSFVASFIGTANLLAGDLKARANGTFRIQLDFMELVISRDEFEQRWPGLKPGRVRVFFRPQAMEVVERDRAHCEVRAAEILFFGDHLRIAAETSSRDRLLLETRTTAGVKAGDSIPIRINQSEIHLLPSDE